MHLRRLARRAAGTGLVLAVAAMPLLSSPAAHGDAIGDLQARANQISQQMTELQGQIQADTNAVEQARYKASQIDAQIQDAAAKLADARRSEASSRKDLSQYALQAYVSGGDGGGDLAAVMGTSADKLGQRQGYASAAVGDRQQLVDNLEASQQVTKEQTAALKSARADAAAIQADAEARQASAQQASAQLAAIKGQLDGQLADLVAQKQAAEQKAAEQKARAEAQAQAQQAAAQQAAAQQADAAAPAVTVPSIQEPPTTSGTSSDPTSTGGSTNFVPPPNASAAATAIAAAESQLGVPYVWGGASPGVGFDCSGLTMWAYAQAGVSLSHLTYSQEGEGRVVPLSDIQPGDLVFYWGAGHVALYIGGGSVIHAPHSGDVVRYGSLYMGPPELVVRPTG